MNIKNDNSINSRIMRTPNSAELKRRRPRIKKKSKSYNDDDVQVFTSLPPKVDGNLRSYLRLQITKLNLLDNSLVASNSYAIRVLWWGEDGAGSIFRPKIFNSKTNIDNSSRLIQCIAKYSVKSGPKQLTAYLNDMGTLDLDLLEEKTMKLLGKAQINDLNQLTFLNPLKKYYSIYNDNKNKIAEVYVVIKLETLNNENQSGDLSAGLTSDTDYNSRSNSLVNTNRNYLKTDDYNLKEPNFSSNNLININNEDTGGPIGNSIITTLLDRGKKLKEEMIKSTLNSKSQIPNIDGLLTTNTTSTAANTITKSKLLLGATTPFSFDSSTDNYQQLLTTNIKNTKTEDADSRLINLFADNKKSNLINQSLITSDLNVTPPHEYDLDDSDLNDPIHDQNIINSLFYNHIDDYEDNLTNIDRFTQRRSYLAHKLNQVEHQPRSRSRSPKNKKLKKKTQTRSNSISRSGSRSRSRSKSNSRSSSRSQNYQTLAIKTSSPLTSRTQKLTNSKKKSKKDLNLSGFESDQSDQSRVSFDMQNSDHEQSLLNDSSSHSNSNSLSIERLNLLGQIHVAKVNVEKIYLIINIQSIIDKLNAKLLQNNENSGKPPKSVMSNKQITYFIEYQFPVVASSRDHIVNTTMATEVMRVASKRIDLVNNEIYFTHCATFPVLFNGNSLELWWKTILVFKIYARLPGMKAPMLVGTTNIPLKQTLKADNLKFDKNLRIIDSSNIQKSSRPSSSSIGTMDCKIELTSNNRDFDEQLMKLRIYEANNPKYVPIVVRQSSQNKSNNNNNNNSSKFVLPSSTTTTTTTSTTTSNLPNSTSSTLTDMTNQVAIQFYLEVSEGRNFAFENQISITDSVIQTQAKQQQQQHQTNREIDSKNLYLVGRLFWCDEKLKSEICWGITKQHGLVKFNLKESLTFFLNKKILERMHNNYMIIEVWNKRLKSGQNDNLVGIVKLPLNQFYIQFKDERLIKLFYLKSKQPCFGCDTWMPVIDPFSGQKTGELNILFAMGSTEQVFNLQNYKLDLLELKENNEHKSSSQAEKFQNEHLFEVKIESINNLKLFDNMIWGETDCYVQYYFPTQVNGVLTMKSYRTQTTLCIPNVAFNEIIKHSIKTSMNLFNIQKELLYAFSNSHSTGNLNYNLQFEVWLRYYYPNVRDQIIAKGELPLNKLCAMLSMNDNENLIKQQLFKIKLYSINLEKPASNFAILNDNSPSSTSLVQTQLCGELGVQINYKINTIRTNNAIKPSNELTLTQVCVNVGIIRACGLKACAKYLKNTEPKLQYACEIGLNVYIKVNLEILNDNFSLNQENIKQTRTIARSFIPEYFHYFDFACPIIWTNENSETISLAELLDSNNVELKFELWHQVPISDTTSGSSNINNDILIGTTNVKLKQLLYKQTGIKGWLPVQSPIIGWKLKKYSANEHHGLPNPLNYMNGGLEVNIRFSQQDDRSRVLEAAKQIGFTRYNDYQYLFNSLTLIDDSHEKYYLFNLSVEQIQLPSHLALRHGEKEIHPATRCYLRYKLFDNEPIQTKCKLVETSINDIDLLKCTFKFNKQHVFNKSAQLLWYLNEEQLEIQVWISYDNQEFKSKPSDKDKLIGSAFMNLDSFNMDNVATAKSIKAKKFYRINGLYPLFKLANNDMSGAFCEVNLTLEKLNDITESSNSLIDNLVIKTTNDNNENEILSSNSSHSQHQINAFSCIIGIERASHLPLVHDRLLNRHVEPNAYVTYSNAKSKNLSFTNIVEHTINPVWNYQETTLFSSDHLFDESKCLILKVWHKVNLDLEQQTPEKSGDKVIGFVSIDLSPLMSGLQQISGWYNIIDMVGQCQGQLKVNLCPQQNLFDFKRTYLSQKSRIERTIPHPSYQNYRPNLNGSYLSNDNIEKHLSSIRLHHESLRNNPHDINQVSSNNTESCLKLNLRKQLDDLDKINEKLKEKLRFSSTITATTETNSTKNIVVNSSTTHSIFIQNQQETHKQEEIFNKPNVENNKNLQKCIDEHTRHLQNAQEILKKANSLINNTNLKENENPSFLKIDQNFTNSKTSLTHTSYDENIESNDKFNTELPPVPSKIKFNSNTNNNSNKNDLIADSFWTSPLASPKSSNSSSTPIKKIIQSQEIQYSNTDCDDEDEDEEENAEENVFKKYHINEHIREDNDKNLNSILIKKNNSDENSYNNNNNNNNDYDFDEPVKVNCVNDDDDIANEENNENENDTDLDQTNNLNLSNNLLNHEYDINNDNNDENVDVIEIKPLNSVSGMNFDFHYNNENNSTSFINNENNNHNSDLTKITNVTSNTILNNENFSSNLNDIQEDETQNDENSSDVDISDKKQINNNGDLNSHQDLVIIGSKITNKNDANNLETIISSNKNKISTQLNIETKALPNFFLPPQDLEKSMRELHFNYKQTTEIPKNNDISSSSSNKSSQNNNRIDELFNRLKSKSPAILNETTNNFDTNNNTNVKFKVDKDLDRLNKIFRAKYNQQ